MMNWLAKTIDELHKLERKKQLVSAISLLVGYRKLKTKFLISTLSEKGMHMILNMTYLSPSGALEEYSYLRMQMKTEES